MFYFIFYLILKTCISGNVVYLFFPPTGIGSIGSAPRLAAEMSGAGWFLCFFAPVALGRQLNLACLNSTYILNVVLLEDDDGSQWSLKDVELAVDSAIEKDKELNAAAGDKKKYTHTHAHIHVCAYMYIICILFDCRF